MPDSPEVADTLGWAYHKTGQQDLAVREFEACLKLRPGSASCQFHLGMVYAAMGKPEPARQRLEIALRTPGFRYPDQARAALGKLNR
jgi:Tfp pilus assembly protein PilF